MVGQTVEHLVQRQLVDLQMVAVVETKNKADKVAVVLLTLLV